MWPHTSTALVRCHAISRARVTLLITPAHLCARTTQAVQNNQCKLQEEAVRSPDAALRGTCAAALLQFLLDWPLQEHRLAQHLQFLVANISFELEDGRLQVPLPARLHVPT